RPDAHVSWLAKSNGWATVNSWQQPIHRALGLGVQTPHPPAAYTWRVLDVTYRVHASHAFRLDSPSPADQATTVQPQCNGSASHTETAVTDLVATWTGWRAKARRQALRVPHAEIAEH